MRRFNVAKEQRKLNRKSNIANNIKIRTIVLSIFVLVGSIMLFTYSKYSTSIKLDLMHSKVANFLQDDYIINAYINGDEDDFPGKNDGYYVDEVVCDKGATGTWDNDAWGLLITDATEEETECNVYFKTLITEFNFEFDPDNDGTGQKFTVPSTGTYKIELWGAQGGSGKKSSTTYAGGKGAYTSGTINLTKSEELYLFVGESNSDFYESGSTAYSAKRVYNNGTTGIGWGTNSADPAFAGGGSTDIRLVNGQWNDFDSIKTRIMVAAGGGGALIYYSARVGGNAGGLTGYAGTRTGSSTIPGGGTQTAAGVSDAGTGTLGKAAYSQWAMSGGGNGWYPGGQGAHASGTVGSGGGGSSFISGYSGCNAIDIDNSTSSNIIHKGNSNSSYNGKDYIFTNGIMIDGAGCNWSTGSASNCGSNQPQPSGANKAGHEGNGYARITLVN